VLPSYCDALTDHWQPVAPASGRLTVMQCNLNTALLVTVLCMRWSVGCSSSESSAVRLCPRMNDLLKLSEYYRIARLFWPILSTIGLSDFHTIVLTLIIIIKLKNNHNIIVIIMQQFIRHRNMSIKIIICFHNSVAIDSALPCLLLLLLRLIVFDC